MGHVTIIAEAGVNHNGSLKRAFEMVEAAKDCGVDFIKFQTFRASNLVTKNAPLAQYQKESVKDNTQDEMLRSLELSFDDFKKLKDYCDKINLGFLSTPFDLESLDFLESLNVPLYKIGSGDLNNAPILLKLNSFKKDVILSTGMATLDEIEASLKLLDKCKVSLLHCTSQYPCPYNNVNMLCLKTLKDRFNLDVGYSDHTKGLEISFMAVSMGASIIEKHFTLDKNLKGPDHKASLDVCELKNLVHGIRHIELALGDGVKTVQGCEVDTKAIARKSLVASCDIKKGEIFTKDNITAKRPGTGLNPMLYTKVLGMVSKKDFIKDDLIEI